MGYLIIDIYTCLRLVVVNGKEILEKRVCWCKMQISTDCTRHSVQYFLTRMKANTPLPSVRSYAEKYSVSPNTIVCAFRLLKNNGVIYSNRTNNYCVSEKIEQIRIMIADKLICNLITDMEHLGYSHKEFLQIFNDYLDTVEAGDIMGKY